jgi:hypothetical protein
MPNIFDSCNDGYPTDRATVWLVREAIPNMPGAYRVLGNFPPVTNDPRFTPIRDRTIAALKQWFDDGRLTDHGWVLGYSWQTIPDVVFLPFDFWVPTGRDGSAADGGYNSGGVCVMGLADYQNFIVGADGEWVFSPRLVISFRRHYNDDGSDRVANLVAWESANYICEATARSDWSDKHGARINADGSITFAALEPDAGYVARPKRRAATLRMAQS